MTLALLGSIHFGIVFFVAVHQRTTSTRRWLMITLAATIPAAGALMAALVFRARGQRNNQSDWENDLELGSGDTGFIPTPDGNTNFVPMLEQLNSREKGLRLEASAGLVGKGDAKSISLLRWTADHGYAEAARDAALGLADIALEQDRRIDNACQAAEAKPCFATWLAVGDAYAEKIYAPVVHPLTLACFADQALHYYRLAAEASQPQDKMAVLAKQARLELTIARPEASLSLLSDASITGETDISHMKKQVAFVVRHFDNAPQEVPLD